MVIIKKLAAAAKSLQSCPTLCNPIDGSPPGFPIPGILQARTLGWVAFPSPVCESEVAQSCSTLRNPMDSAYQAPPFMGFSRQEYWSGVPLPSPSKSLKVINTGEGVEKREPFYTVSGDVNRCSRCGKQYGDSLKKLKIKLPYDPAIPILGIYSKRWKM